MKAIRVHKFGGPEVLSLEEVPDPVAAPGQVVIETRAIGVNPVETYIRAGKYGPMQFPYTPGSDAAGVIISVGDGVGGLNVGDRVYTFKTISGAYGAKTLSAAESVRKLPDHVTFDQGASLGVPAATAYRALHIRGQAKAGETVLIHGGSGGVGTAAIQLARIVGLTVIASAGDEAGKQLVLEQGAHHAVGHGAVQDILALTGGRGVNLVLENLANVNLQKDLQMLAPAGRVVVIGNRGTVEIDPRETMKREADIRGMTLMASTPQELIAIHAGLRAALEANALRPVIGKRIPLAEAARAHREIIEDRARGKMVLVP